EELADGPVGNRDGDAHTDARHRAAVAGKEGKGHRDQRHDESEERAREFAIEADLQGNGVDAAALQVANVSGQLLEVHLLVLKYFLQEIIGPLFELFKRG